MLPPADHPPVDQVAADAPLTEMETYAVTDWSSDDLETAYRRALSALESSDGLIPAPVAAPPAAVTVSTEAPPAQPPPEPEVRPTAGTAPQVSPSQIIEACLFVGGQPFTARKLLGLLRSEADPTYVERLIDGLNERYTSENRPYAIQLVEGGYVLTLLGEYERIRAKVYGQGPREVRFSQEALEILAVIAYQQPITEAEIRELGRPQCGPVLRQLLRREFIAVERAEGNSRNVRYVTTPRFLQLFGIPSLDDLPRPEQLVYK